MAKKAKVEEISIVKAVALLAEEKGINAELLYDTIETAIVMGLKRKHATEIGKEKDANVATPYDNVEAKLNRETSEIKVYVLKQIVEEIEDPETEVTLEEAAAQFGDVEMGDVVRYEMETDTREMGRMVAQTAKQIITQKIREIERGNVFEGFIKKEKELVTGEISRIQPVLDEDGKETGKYNVFLKIDHTEVILPPEEQVENERYVTDQRLKVFVVNVKRTTKSPVITISRRHKDLIKRLFEQVVPEIQDGTVLVKGIAREAGSRSKMAVASTITNVDPVGSCIGQGGGRIGEVLTYLNSSKEGGEKIDIIEYSDRIEKYISNALAPAKVMDIRVNLDTKEAKVLVSRDIFSLAIGKDGQNVRLAAKLTGWKIDIVSDEQVSSLDDL